MADPNAIETVIRITDLSQQRGYAPLLNGKPVFSDWSYSAEIEVEIKAAGLSVMAKTTLPLDEEQWAQIWETKIEAHQLLKAKVEEVMDMWDRAKSALTGGPICDKMDSPAESELEAREKRNDLGMPTE